jgi:hypothetical protein
VNATFNVCRYHIHICTINSYLRGSRLPFTDKQTCRAVTCMCKPKNQNTFNNAFYSKCRLWSLSVTAVIKKHCTTSDMRRNLHVCNTCRVIIPLLPSISRKQWSNGNMVQCILSHHTVLSQETEKKKTGFLVFIMELVSGLGHRTMSCSWVNDYGNNSERSMDGWRVFQPHSHKAVPVHCLQST